MRIFKSTNFWGGLAVALTLLAGIAVSIALWDWFREGTENAESYGATIRNIGLLIGGVVALVFAIWRTIVAQRQLDVAQRGLLNDRYQKGAEMLGNNSLVVRLGGIYALRNLAKERPEQYHVQVMSLLCAFVRHPVQEGEATIEDIQAAMDVIGSRHQALIELEEKQGFVPDLSRAMLRGMNLTRAMLYKANLYYATLDRVNLHSAILHRADLSCATLEGSDLSDAMLYEANVSRIMLREANLSGAILDRANLSGATLSLFCGDDTVEGLTQTQLDKAVAAPDNPPKLKGALDAETEEPLVWRGKSPKDE